MDDGTLKPSRSGAVCMTCNHFRYAVGKQCQTLLTCPIHQRLIPQGEHLNRKCQQWIMRRELEVGWAPEVAEQESLFTGGVVRISALPDESTAKRPDQLS